MGTKNNPGEFDCYANAAPDEPMFILLARDPKAPDVVYDWADMYVKEKTKDGASLTPEQLRKYGEALSCATAMENWRKANVK